MNTINYDAILRRVKKAVEVAGNRENAAAVHILTVDDSVDSLHGLVIILSQKTTEARNAPQETTK